MQLFGYFSFILLLDSTVEDLYGKRRASAAASNALNRLDSGVATQNLTKNNVLSIQPCSRASAQEELTTVSARAGVRHAQHTGTLVAEVEVLVVELVAVDGLSAGSVVVREVAALAHEVGDDAVETRALEAEPLVVGAEGLEVLGGLRDDVLLQLHHDLLETADAPNVHLEKDLHVGLVDLKRRSVALLELLEVLRGGQSLRGKV